MVHQGLYTANPWMVGFPFFFYGVFLFISSFISYRRSKQVSIPEVQDGVTISSAGTLVFLQMSAPVLHLLCFDETGKLAGQIKSRHRTLIPWLLPASVINMLPKDWILYDAKGNVLAKYRQAFGINPPLETYDAASCKMGEFVPRLWGGLLRIKGKLTDANGEELAPVDVAGSLYDYRVIDRKGKQWFRFRKGWMPLAMGERFKEKEAPLVSFHPELSEHERFLSLGLISYFIVSSKKE